MWQAFEKEGERNSRAFRASRAPGILFPFKRLATAQAIHNDLSLFLKKVAHSVLMVRIFATAFTEVHGPLGESP